MNKRGGCKKIMTSTVSEEILSPTNIHTLFGLTGIRSGGHRWMWTCITKIFPTLGLRKVKEDLIRTKYAITLQMQSNKKMYMIGAYVT